MKSVSIAILFFLFIGCDETSPTPVGDVNLPQDDTALFDIQDLDDLSVVSDVEVFEDIEEVDAELDAVEETIPCPEDMVLIPGGVFVMGDEEGNPDAQPPHDVTLSPYCIDRTEVSVATYEACVVDGVCDDFQTFEICITLDPVRPNSCKEGREDHPANYVSWNRAMNFCEWAGKTLPTEAQWERAARGPDGLSYPWGETIGCKLANYEQGFIFDACAVEGQEGDTKSVESYVLGASAEGLLNLAGNVDEWVKDWHSSSAYNITDAVDPQGPEEGELKVFRGGAFSGPAFTLLTYWRQTGLGVDIASQTSGFRCAAEPLESR